MDRQEQTFIPDKRERWGDGPWLGEPDRVQWTSKSGLPCLALRHQKMGHWCGYVAVPQGHPWHSKHYDHVDAKAHGGLTYSDHAKPGERVDDDWWLGFDCAHAYDGIPSLLALGAKLEGSYRPLAFIEVVCELLAEQVVAASEPG